VVGADAVHVTGLVGDSAEEIASAYDDCDLDAEAVNVRKLGGDFVDARGVDSKTLLGSQGFTGDLQQDALEDGSGHVCQPSAISP